MKKIIAIILVLLTVMTLAACGSNEELTAAQAEIQQLQAKLTEMENASEVSTVYSLHATIDGQTSVELDGEKTLTAQAVMNEGQVVDHWELNGVVQANAEEETFSFTASESTIVEAILRAEKKVTTVNCELRFLDDKGKAAGDTYEEFTFEKTYQHPVTEEEITDGTITVQVSARIPSGYVLDYWKINGVEYRPASTCNSFVVTNLDEATEYEAVLKEKPITYYKVTCYGCTVNGKTELWVAAGTTVTAVANNGFYAEFAINGVAMNNKWTDPYVKTWTFTVNKDTHVEAYAIIN